jgi:trans-aconitate 2-methyltransferase
LKYKVERSRPAEDLIRRIPPVRFNHIFDLGCGTGEITKRLYDRWPGAVVTGLDLSGEMLACARHLDSGVVWVNGDIARWHAPVSADLIFSNSVLHRIPKHDSFLVSLLQQLRKGAVLAIQMPHPGNSPAYLLLDELARAGPWSSKLTGVITETTVNGLVDYSELMSSRCAYLDLWETEYLHVLPGRNPVFEWMRGSPLVPVLAALDQNEQEAFLWEYGNRLLQAYPPRINGRTLFSVRRIFLIAQK